MSTLDRLLPKFVIPEGQSETTGCWEWTGKVNNANYGQFTERRVGVKSPVNVYVHRRMHTLIEGQYIEFDLDDDPLGPILLIEKPALTDDDTIDHLCCFRRCGNPDHWAQPVTRAENSKLMQRRKKNGNTVA